MHYYSSDDPHKCPYFCYFGYYEETPSNSHLYMYRKKYPHENRKHGADSGDDDDYEDHTTHDSDAGVETCATGLGLMSLYDPCTSDYFTESDSQGKPRAMYQRRNVYQFGTMGICAMTHIAWHYLIQFS